MNSVRVALGKVPQNKTMAHVQAVMTDKPWYSIDTPHIFSYYITFPSFSFRMVSYFLTQFRTCKSEEKVNCDNSMPKNMIIVPINGHLGEGGVWVIQRAY